MSSSSLLIFARLLGFFLLSPLFAKRNIPSSVRFGLAAVCSLLLAPPLTLKLQFDIDSPLFWITFGKELILGYALGFLFSLLFEAAALTGQIIGTMGGFSITELFGAGMHNSIFAKFFSLTLFTLFLATDLHHILLRFLYESFDTIAILPNGLHLATSSSAIFWNAFSYAFVPFLALSLLLVCFAIIARSVPDLQIFWVGFPLQLLIAILTITIALSSFGEILQKAFFEFLTLAKRLFFPL
ncbi:MAG: Flagellar biosynthetic protein FliR [Chlamydiales bacterium]|nr:Flagellar biosynthetic protein FliR [Chlamydiales bacterium]MCH9635195.1 Flagellar biosynthetic protein FliR [Chlamydiales bacterium]MCH9704275.1 flagellar biosynthetic protein FliR [Chlamydiota bacterium]